MHQNGPKTRTISFCIWKRREYQQAQLTSKLTSRQILSRTSSIMRTKTFLKSEILSKKEQAKAAHRCQVELKTEPRRRINREEQRSLGEAIQRLSTSDQKAEARRAENRNMAESLKWHGLSSHKTLLIGLERIEGAQRRLVRSIGSCFGLRRTIWISRPWIWVMISVRTTIKLSKCRNPKMISDPPSCCLILPTLLMKANIYKLWTKAEACKMTHAFGRVLDFLKSTLPLLQANSYSKWIGIALRICNQSSEWSAKIKIARVFRNF